MSDLRPIGEDVRRLGRVPAVDALVVAARAVWRSAVGEQIAQHALPVRRSAGALVVHCSDAGWVSELTLLERQVRAKLATALGEAPPLRFAVGDIDVPEPGPEQRRRDAPAPSPEQILRARELASPIVDSALRAAAERAIAASLARRS